jgi:hypothetical protein
MKYSVNQLEAKLQTIVTNHFQLKGFLFGDPSDIGASGPVDYPFLLADCLPSNMSTKSINLSIQLMVMDIVKKDLSNENEVLSDTLQMLEDVYIKLRDINQSNYILSDSASMSPFTDSQGDEVAGWTATVTLQIPSSYNSCEIPSN